MSAAQDMFVGKQQEVKGFMRVNTKEERIKQDEIELAEMKAEQGMSPEEKEDNKEPASRIKSTA